MSTHKLQEDMVLDINPRTKRATAIVHLVVTSIFVVAVFILICVWIWEEVDKSEMYLANQYLQDPKFAQARYVLMLGYCVSLLLLFVLQCCLTGENDPTKGPVRGPQIITSITAGLLLMVYIGASLMAYFAKNNDLADLRSTMNAQISEIYMNDTDYSTTGKAFNVVQSKLGCCGVDGESDYAGTEFENDTGLQFPYSCCDVNSDAKGSSNISQADVKDWTQCQARNADYFNSAGCYTEVHDSCKSICTEIVIIGFIGAMLLLIAMVFRLATEAYFEKRHQKYIKQLVRRHERHEIPYNSSKVMPIRDNDESPSGSNPCWIADEDVASVKDKTALTQEVDEAETDTTVC